MVNWFLISLSFAGFIFLVRHTDGPWDIFYNFRVWIGIYDLLDEQGRFYEKVEDRFLAQLVNCPWCFSSWLMLFATVIMYRLEFWKYWLSGVFLIGLLSEILLLVRDLRNKNG